ncbi:MAG: hypothetical protein IKN27_08030 [Selenomonadaceae bacterium]|nr:hypothetical protein [Selenomonadaceae bacterium]
MGVSADFSQMNHAIIEYINANIPKDKNAAQFGIVNGGRVIIGNKSYSYVPTVDLYFGDQDKVACILPENSSSAAVVGVP